MANSTTTYGYGSQMTNTYMTPMSGGTFSGSTTTNNTGLSVEIVDKVNKKIVYTGSSIFEHPSPSNDLIEEITLYIFNDWLHPNPIYTEKINQLNLYFYGILHPDWSDGKSPLHLQIKNKK